MYWRPVYAVLESDFRLLLVNARHVKHVPGRKTLIQDRSSQVNRVAKILELANVKLGSVVSNIMGVTGRAIWKP